MGVPYQSLYSRVKQKRKPAGEAHEGQMLFSLAEEKSMVRWMEMLDDKGFPARVSMLRELAQRKLAKRNSQHQLGQHFVCRFLNRHPSLSTKFSKQVHRQRALASNPQHLRHYFDKLRAVMSKRNISEQQIYNMDEKGILLGVASRVKVICRRGRRNPNMIQGEKSTESSKAITDTKFPRWQARTGNYSGVYPCQTGCVTCICDL
jgi:hypothetical protein